MKLLNRYLLQQFLRILLLCLAAFVGIYLLIDFFEKVSDFIDHRATPGQYLVYLLNSVPLICSQVTPLAILMATVLTLGSLGRTNEITAMRACGISLWRIVKPIMILVLIVSALLLLINEQLVPLSARKLNYLLETELKGTPQLVLTKGRIWYRDQGRIVNVALVRPEVGQLQGVTLFELDKEFRLLRRLEAPRADYRDGHWQAGQLLEQRFDPLSGDLLESHSHQDRQLEIGRTPQEFGAGAGRNNELNFMQLYRTVQKLRAEGYQVTRHLVDMHSRLAAPFTCLIMAFLGVPFALQRGRGSSIALGIGLSLAVGVAYFIIQSLILAFGYSGALPPLVAAWAANLIFLLLGIWLLLSARE